MYGYSGASTVFNKEELGKNVKKLYDDILQEVKNNGTGELKAEVEVHATEQKEHDANEYQLSESPKMEAESFDEQRQEGAGRDKGEEGEAIE